jgi:hypothetical protein
LQIALGEIERVGLHDRRRQQVITQCVRAMRREDIPRIGIILEAPSLIAGLGAAATLVCRRYYIR